jgi:indolepyruvate ferredoxin oxidoreductase alpha subunit
MAGWEKVGVMAELLSGNEAVAAAAWDAGILLGTGYPGTPSTEILEEFARIGGRAQWAPNEKVALEVGMGTALSGGRSLVTMKHVGLNVAADPLFTAAYMDVPGALVIVSADDPGTASSQNEQDNRRYAVAAGVPMLEPSDSQEAYEFTLRAIEIAERWRGPVLLRMTTRVCHSKTRVEREGVSVPAPRTPEYRRNVQGRVMIPVYARLAHERLLEKLAQMARWNEQSGPTQEISGSRKLGIVTSGISYQHVREAAPEASVLKLGMTHPLPMETIRRFAQNVERCMVVEEGDPYLYESIRSAGIDVEASPSIYRIGELNVKRVRRILEGDSSPETKPAPGKPPAFCPGCPHRSVYAVLKKLDCIVSGDIGCYGLGVLPPYESVDTTACMGASIGIGLGMRHALQESEARRVISVIGDGTFLHSGIPGIAEMVYNPPPTGHLVLIMDNGTTAMTGMQEHPGTGRTLDHHKTGKVVIEEVIKAMGVRNVHIVDATLDPAGFEDLMKTSLEKPELTVIINRRDCLLAAKSIREYERCDEQSN